MRYLIALLAAAFLALSPLSVCAQTDEGESPAADAQAELDMLKSSITVSADKMAALSREIDEMKDDRVEQSAALIASAQRIKIAETEVAAVEGRLTALLQQESEIQFRLDSADGRISQLLAILQRIRLNPPPALIIDPADALGSARGGLLLASVMPQLKAQATQVASDLSSLGGVRAGVETEAATLKGNYEGLLEEQLRIAALLEARKRGVESLSADLQDEEQVAAELGTRASSLTQLISTLSERIERVNNASGAAAAATRRQAKGALSDEEIRLALADTARTEPALPFSQARGYLVSPAAGVTVTDFGTDDGFGGVTNGISIVTRRDAQVVSPADGWVLYKGPYLNYGQIVILNPGDGYTLLLAGLDAIDVDLGQFVLEGEPLGKMGSRTLGETVTTNAGVSRPTLYIEFRRSKTPIDPTGWWRLRQNQTQNG